jgi:hypothetical protein
MTRLTPEEYQTVLRYDLMTFLERSFYTLNPQTPFHPNWHLEAMAAKLEDCRQGRCTRLIFTVPPRSLKSILTSIAFPAWLLGHAPAAHIINVSYGQELADKLARDTRTVMQAEWYQAVFPTRLSGQRHAAQDFMTTDQGCRLATLVGGVLTGRGELREGPRRLLTIEPQRDHSESIVRWMLDLGSRTHPVCSV